jgi:hypothetical protein
LESLLFHVAARYFPVLFGAEHRALLPCQRKQAVDRLGQRAGGALQEVPHRLHAAHDFLQVLGGDEEGVQARVRAKSAP